jgi:K+-transporting ATPase ATPase C chain
MLKHFGTALRLTVASIAIFGLIYPFAMTGLSQVIFPYQAGGAPVRDARGAVVGSDIIGQAWHEPYYFHGRPSAAGKNGYDPTSTGGTNLGPTSKKLIDATRAAIAALKKENPDAALPIPMDLVTSSASGIDPDISPAAAYYQVPRVAKARGVPIGRLTALVRRAVRERTWRFLGEPRVNVLTLNLALDRVWPVSGVPARPRR